MTKDIVQVLRALHHTPNISNRAADEIERLRAAVAPFSWYYSVNDCAETDQKTMEVPVSDLRRAFETYPVTEPPPANQ